jgi:hypothetical protein
MRPWHDGGRSGSSIGEGRAERASRQPDWSRIEKENPGLSIKTTRFIGEGWNARAFVVKRSKTRLDPRLFGALPIRNE